MPRSNPPKGWILVRHGYTVEAYSYLRLFPGAKRRTRVHVHGFTVPDLYLPAKAAAKRKRRKPSKPKPKPKPKPKKPPKPTRKTIDAATRGTIGKLASGKWLAVDEYLAQLEAGIRGTDPDARFEIDDPIYRIAGVAHWVSTDDLLVWEHRLKGRSMESLGFSNIWVIRVWALLFHANTGDYHVICRARSFRMTHQQAERSVTSYSQAKAEADDVFEAVKDWSEKNTDYGQVVGPMIAWTFWGGGKDSVKTDPKTGHLAPQGEVAPREGLPFK